MTHVSIKLQLVSSALCYNARDRQTDGGQGTTFNAASKGAVTNIATDDKQSRLSNS